MKRVEILQESNLSLEVLIAQIVCFDRLIADESDFLVMLFKVILLKLMQGHLQCSLFLFQLLVLILDIGWRSASVRIRSIIIIATSQIHGIVHRRGIQHHFVIVTTRGG